jgi:GntR family transcriptional regulator, transcriptional repressor for pyruvate dehydrogenase complex
MVFEAIKKSKIGEKVAETIREAIVAGKLGTGEALPSERDLAAQFGVNRSTVREALMRLESWGLIEIRQGGATKILDLFTKGGLQLLPFMIAPGGRIDWKLMRDLLDIRRMLLSWTAQEAARRATRPRLKRLEQIVSELEKASSLPERQRLDFEFYRELVLLSENRVLLLFSNALWAVYRHNIEGFQFLYERDRFDARLHRRTLCAILANRPEAAGRAMAQYAKRALEALP